MAPMSRRAHRTNLPLQRKARPPRPSGRACFPSPGGREMRSGFVRLGVWLRLGRVSNLPTVWTNVLAALALAGALRPEPVVPLLALAFSVFYVGGMYLNDAFDRRIDAVERPNRPIPSGQVSAAAVFAIGFACLLLGTLLTALCANTTGASVARAAGS